LSGAIADRAVLRDTLARHGERAAIFSQLHTSGTDIKAAFGIECEVGSREKEGISTPHRDQAESFNKIDGFRTIAVRIARPSNSEKFTNASERGSQFESPQLHHLKSSNHLPSQPVMSPATDGKVHACVHASSITPRNRRRREKSLLQTTAA
jgi:hypothetical protein